MVPCKEPCHLNKSEIIFCRFCSSCANGLKGQSKSHIRLLFPPPPLPPPISLLSFSSSGSLPLGSLIPSFLCIPLANHPSSYQNNHNNLQTDSLPIIPAHSNPAHSHLIDSPFCNTDFCQALCLFKNVYWFLIPHLIMSKSLRVRIKASKIKQFLAFGYYLNAKFHIHMTTFNQVLKRNLAKDFSHQWKWIAGSPLGSGVAYLNLLFVSLRNKGWSFLTSMDEYQHFHHLEMISYSFLWIVLSLEVYWNQRQTCLSGLLKIIVARTGKLDTCFQKKIWLV